MTKECYILRETDTYDEWQMIVAVFPSYPTAKELKDCTEEHGFFRDCEAMPISFYEELAEKSTVDCFIFDKRLDIIRAPFYEAEN